MMVTTYRVIDAAAEPLTAKAFMRDAARPFLVIGEKPSSYKSVGHRSCEGRYETRRQAMARKRWLENNRA